ncbi:PAS domain-containing sensor histidine kinase [Clostridium botulinum]|uniref:histidine kinase n=1 Tax=Clostridium botulinum (strain Hall / ATCC 3502 / NCTC 13319 / Type A) TaxID=441771 RepID=A5HYN0_CLOBH|nr:PAS domain-containing sensor histidine kinase [Clostridium botulinum]MBD5588704.1 PAS domain-containing sensor histidine kinase [Clostridium botulinum]MBO0570896.1 PAS domain-containing sensor histidine kinase [Clostridium botulinum]MBY6899767.1 PAS domain-containing sensor histidine kinase [Clostridium botulinum]MBY6913880.1 PAS domain-containing sensor histidine kinase [Clostridium botulinum]MBY6924658.1 PAS domain-containing sensor histidine kinase [Clostridium botulinum]
MNLDKIEIRNWSHDKKIYNSMLIVKFIILLFCGGAIYLDYAEKNNKNISQNFYCNALNLVIIIICLVSVYFIWMFISIKAFKFERIKTIQVIENTISIVIFTFIIMMSGSYKSSYKFLFLVAIITATIQLGMKHGIITSLVSSIIILAIDLILAPKAPVNIYFETDLILVGVFIMTAWPLGYYVNIQKEDLRQKEEEVNILANKLDQKEMQKRCMEQLLIKNENCYNLLIRNSKDAILVHRYGKIIFANERLKQMLGYKKEYNFEDIDIKSLIPKDEYNTVKNKLENLYYGSENVVNFQHNVINNKEKTIQNTSTYVIYDGMPTIFSILHDVTSKIQVEKLEQDVKKNIELLNESREYNKLITEFLSNISHELKTPLNVIFTAVQLLDFYEKDVDYEKQDKYLKLIKQNCYRLMKLINNLLDTTKLDSGYLRLNLVNYNIVSLIEEITLSVTSYAESKGINIIFDTEMEERVIAVDTDKIERIILNLLSNAIKFTNPGGNIFVNIKDSEENVYVHIKDTGVGIPSDKLESIFERFFQIDKTLKKNKEGTGIGLHLVKSFVEMHNGKVTINSELGKGTEFIIKLPAIVCEEQIKSKNVVYEANIERINMEFSDITQ